MIRPLDQSPTCPQEKLRIPILDSIQLQASFLLFDAATSSHGALKILTAIGFRRIWPFFNHIAIVEILRFQLGWKRCDRVQHRCWYFWTAAEIHERQTVHTESDVQQILQTVIGDGRAARQVQKGQPAREIPFIVEFVSTLVTRAARAAFARFHCSIFETGTQTFQPDVGYETASTQGQVFQTTTNSELGQPKQ